MQIELLKDNAIEFRGKFCYMWLMVLKPIYKQFIESCICPMLYRKSDVTLLYGTFLTLKHVFGPFSNISPSEPFYLGIAHFFRGISGQK